MNKFLLIVLIYFISFSSFALEESSDNLSKSDSKTLESYSNDEVKEVNGVFKGFIDLSGRPINQYSQDSPSIFEPRYPTPPRFFSADLSIPDKFSSTNNLVKKVGAFYRAFGEVIFIQGKL